MAKDDGGMLGKLPGYVLVIVLLIAFAGLTTYAVMSDTSIHGVTVKFYGVTRYCSTNPANGNQVLTFSFASVVAYSTASLQTSLSRVSFSMSSAGVPVSSLAVADSSFGPGQSVSYKNLTFINNALDPHSQPSSALIDLTINARVSAGLFSSQASASDSQTVQFGAPPC